MFAIGGAEHAGELDAKRAIDQGVRSRRGSRTPRAGIRVRHAGRVAGGGAGGSAERGRGGA